MSQISQVLQTPIIIGWLCQGAIVFVIPKMLEALQRRAQRWI